MSAGTSLGDVPDWLKVPDAGTLVGILAETAKAGLVAGITPAEVSVVAGALTAAREHGRIGFFRSRPLLSDAIATAAALATAAETGAAVHLRQISCRDPRTLVGDAVRRGDVDFWAAPDGFPGVQPMVWLVLEAVNAGRITWSDLVRLRAEAAARRFGLFPRMGRVRLGSDADIVIVDSACREQILLDQQLSRAKARPFVGRQVTGWPVLTRLRGTVVMRDGDVADQPGGCVIELQRRVASLALQACRCARPSAMGRPCSLVWRCRRGAGWVGRRGRSRW